MPDHWVSGTWLLSTNDADQVSRDEILNGKTHDKNSNYFARFCFEQGIELLRRFYSVCLLISQSLQKTYWSHCGRWGRDVSYRLSSQTRRFQHPSWKRWGKSKACRKLWLCDYVWWYWSYTWWYVAFHKPGLGCPTSFRRHNVCFTGCGIQSASRAPPGDFKENVRNVKAPHGHRKTVRRTACCPRTHGFIPSRCGSSVRPQRSLGCKWNGSFCSMFYWHIISSRLWGWNENCASFLAFLGSSKSSSTIYHHIWLSLLLNIDHFDIWYSLSNNLQRFVIAIVDVFSY